MNPASACSPRPTDPQANRPLAFLVSTTPCARDISRTLGAPAYSYSFVLESLIPVLKQLGIYKQIDHPESSLDFAAKTAAIEGYLPIHLCLNPLQDAYLSPTVPNVLFPFWEFPDIPDREFGNDTRQNWRRIASRADLILTACGFTAAAFRKAKLTCPIAVVPVPLGPERFEVPAWNPSHVVRFPCRHEVFGGTDDQGHAEGCQTEPESTASTSTESSRGSLPKRLAQSGFRRLEPWLDPEFVARICRFKQRMAGRSPAQIVYLSARASYHNTIRQVLNDEAIHRITELKNHALRRLGRSTTTVVDPLLPSGVLNLSGLVFTTFLNLGDLRKNEHDLLTAFLTAFRDRNDVTLVIKLATSPHREFHEMAVFRQRYRTLGIEHRCRIVVITEYLDDARMAELLRATTYYVNTSHAEGACLPLQHALAAGRPAIAPDHTAMADYMDRDVGFVIRSNPEPTHWPHDPEKRLETVRYRLVWTDVRDHLLESAMVAESRMAQYSALSRAARDRMLGFASIPVAAEAMRSALSLSIPVEKGQGPKDFHRRFDSSN